eukprot:Em0022g333a
MVSPGVQRSHNMVSPGDNRSNKLPTILPKNAQAKTTQEKPWDMKQPSSTYLKHILHAVGKVSWGSDGMAWTVQGEKASHTKRFPIFHGTIVMPSGRFPSERSRPVGWNVSVTRGTQHNQPSSLHLASLVLCFLSSVARAAEPADIPTPIKVSVLSREVTGIPKAALLPVAQLVNKRSAVRLSLSSAANNMSRMQVVKRDGRKEKVMFDKITSRISKLCYGLNQDYVDPAEITMKVISGVYNGVTTVELDTLAAEETTATMTTKHPDYAILAARIAVSNLHKETKKQFSTVMDDLYNYVNPKNGRHSPMISQEVHEIIVKNADRLNSAIIYDRDFNYQYFGFKTLERSYLLKINGKVAERPQHMLMRVAVGIHKNDIDAAIETYDLMSERWKPKMATANAACSMRQSSVEYVLLAYRDWDNSFNILLAISFDLSLAAACLNKESYFRQAADGLMQRVKCLGRVAVDATEGRVCQWTGVVGTAAAARRARGYVMSLPMTPLVGTGPQLEAARAARVALSSYAGEWFSEIVGIYDTLKMCANISKSAGGIGLAAHCIRASGSYIAGTQWYFQWTCYQCSGCTTTQPDIVDQGGNKRPGAFACCTWSHGTPEYIDFLGAQEESWSRGKAEHGISSIALWIPDLFMKRVESNGHWSLHVPRRVAQALADVWGDKFEELYTKYEKEGRVRKVVEAQKLWFAILESQTETGTPYMLYKDSCNGKSNQQNLGTIKCSNLCTEIVEYTAPNEVAVCNLASIALNMYVTSEGVYDFKKLFEITKVMTRNLNKIIDVNYYPVPEAEYSNKRHRPIGIGVQGLADAFILMRYPFDSPQAEELNKKIFETIYFGALTASCELAAKYGPYDTYQGSPVSQGILQFDMWGVTPSDLWDWATLKADIAKYGVRNSLLVAPMPTASTAQILGNNESIEPYTSNIYTRRVLSGEFQIVNHHLLKDLTDRGLWDEELKQKLIAHNGSVQNIDEIPEDLKGLYKTVWEISQKTLINMAADRGAYIDQSQSFNVHIAEPNFGKLTSMHFYAWKKGLKTGMYYLRTQPAANAIQFTVDQRVVNEVKKKQGASSGAAEDAERAKDYSDMACSLQNREGCISCSA